ncbi:YoaK family protein [Isoptericola sp. b515]|uniref:YoaK family protein n=1 Tax=Isoptericola sp. b515 TaxID=3064652 RepID=UPI002712C3FD|nr:YoaK family protein [Isoptericola sp. b515]MDO8148003.1 YoaK family protein [Isoptericola sp. b515]
MPRDHLHLGLMLALTFSTGIADAVGFLGLDRVFTGNMTGNVVILGMGVAGADDLPVVGPLLAFVTFLAGAGLGGLVLRADDVGWSGRTTACFGAVGAVLVALTVLLGVHDTDMPHGVQLTVTGMLAGAMGLQAAAARHLAVKEITTVVVTSAITGLAMDSRLVGGHGRHVGRRVAAIVLLGAGAGVGAALLQIHLALGVAVSAVIALAVTVVGHLRGRETA